LPAPSKPLITDPHTRRDAPISRDPSSSPACVAPSDVATTHSGATPAYQLPLQFGGGRDIAHHAEGVDEAQCKACGRGCDIRRRWRRMRRASTWASRSRARLQARPRQVAAQHSGQQRIAAEP
jgi:hypothetical protein